MTSMKAIYFLSLDKTLYPMHNQVIFKQYNLNALVKYRMLFNSVIFDCCPFIYIYIYNVTIMLVFYHPGTESVTHYLINRLDRKQLLECQTISFDCLYTCNMDSHQKVCYLYWCFDCKQKRFTKKYQEIER